MACAGLLTGCALGTASFPDTPAATTQVTMPAVQGSDYGGHAPLVGAHVFVIQPGNGGYGSKATSLIPSAGLTTQDFYGNTFTTTQDTVTGSPTNGMYYITTSNIGTFALSGDYTCAAGYPVYLYASGGNPQTVAPVTVTGATGTVDANNKTLITFSTSGTNLLYQGESVTFGTFTTGGPYNSFSGQTEVVSSLNLTTSSFAVELGSNIGAIGNVAFTTTVAQAAAPSNPGVVNLALLGTCGGTVVNLTGASSSQSGGNLLVTFSNSGTNSLVAGEQVKFGTIPAPYSAFSGTTQTVSAIGLSSSQFGVLLGAGGNLSTVSFTSTASPLNNFNSTPFVYMNEVSTVAAAYALAPFATTVTTNDALHIGTSSTNVVGLQNAATIAANLYDIGGSVIGTGGDGETHIARATTPNGGYGTVPQTLINTIADALASCVDSANLYGVTATGAAESTQCASLFNNATVDGTAAGTKPYDTATAAINIAHNPLGSAANYVSNIFGAITGNSPFQPVLSTAPHDYALAITYTTPAASGALGGVSVDGSGNVWTVGMGSNAVYELSPNAAYTTYTPPTGSVVTTAFISSAEIDATSSNVYVPAVAGMLKFTPGNTTGTLVTALNTVSGSGVTLDNSGNLFIANAIPAAEATSYIQKESIAGVAAGGNFPLITSSAAASCTYEVQYVLADASGNIWSNNQGNAAPANAICRYSNAGVLQYEWQFPTTSSFPLSYGLAVDNGGNVWFSDKDNNAVFKIAAGSTGTYTAANTGVSCATTGTGCTQATGGTVATPFSVAVDGNNTVWVSDSNLGGLVQFANSGTAITPSYLAGTSGYLTNVLSLQADQSGSMWGNSYTSARQLVQYIGIAAPTTMPLSYARANSKLGAKP
jgi:streptogramin lyase